MTGTTRAPRSRTRAGISTIEMVTTIAVTGILSVGLAGIMRHPMQGYSAVSRRSELVDLADLAILRMGRDLRMALPNSIRVNEDGTVIELLHVAAGARYRSEPGVNASGRDHTDASDWLSFGGDASWNLIGRVSGLTFDYGSALAAGTRVAIYPTGVDVWTAAATDANPSIITASSNAVTLIDDGDEDQIALASAHRFSFGSPQGRLYLVDTPVTYLCDSGTSALWRVDRYAIDSEQPTSLAAAPLAAGGVARATDRVERCAFGYVPGTPSRSGLVTLEVVIASEEERVRLLHQVPIPNAP